MTRAGGGDQEPVEERRLRGLDQSIVRGGLAGIAAVTLATVLVGAAGAVIALVVSLIY